MQNYLEAAIGQDVELAEAVRALAAGRISGERAPGLESAMAPGGDVVTAARQDQGLEAIIRKHGRPSLLVFNGWFEPPMLEPWTERLLLAGDALAAAIAASGRVEVKGIGQPMLGTAWMIEKDIAVTNRHVAAVFARPRNGFFDIDVDENGRPFEVVVDFLAEADNRQSHEVRVVNVLYVASEADGEADVAFLQLDPGGNAPAPVALGDGAALATHELLAVIGFPAPNGNNDAADINRIFAGGLEVKRLAPGWALGSRPDGFTHDASVMNGSSGSIVVSLAQQAAVGLHYWGQEGVENRAVGIAEVRRLLDRALGRSGPNGPAGPAGPATPGEGEEAAPPPDLGGRVGYVATGFLHDAIEVPVPTPIDGAEATLTPLLAPEAGADRFELRFRHYSSFMHKERKLPMFTAVNIDGTAMDRIKRADRDRWFLDPRIDKDAQFGPKLYADNPLDQGHLVRRLDPAWGDDPAGAIEDTFFYSNCAPQHSSLNRKTWLALEDYVLESAETHGFRVCVFTGPVFSDDDPEYRTCKIPQAFWKVVVALKGDAGGGAPTIASSAYALSQTDLVANLEFAYGPFRTYQVPVARVARWARLAFDPAIVAADAMGAAGPEAAAESYRAIDGPGDLVL